MEMKFREAGHSSQLIQFYLAIQILAKIVDDPINPLGIFAVRLVFTIGTDSICRKYHLSAVRSASLGGFDATQTHGTPATSVGLSHRARARAASSRLKSRN